MTTKIMGIINITPDSFSGDGLYVHGKSCWDRVFMQAHKMCEEGVDILDIGGESTRPGATPISVQEECDRVLPIIEGLKRKFPQVPLSIDTTKSVIAKEAVHLGADIINDVSGGEKDPDIIKVAATAGIPYILTHFWDRTYRHEENIQDIVSIVYADLQKKIFNLESHGLKKDTIIIDPGVGFGKTSREDFALVVGIHTFKSLGYPVLLGVSRKSCIGNMLNVPPSERLTGTIALHTIAFYKGVDIVRVHDVHEARQALTIVNAVKELSLC